MSTGKHNMYYVAIVCTGKPAKRIRQYKQWMKEHFACTVAMRSPAHITLIPPFWIDELQENKLRRVLQAFESDIGQIDVHLNGFDHFGNRVLFVNPANSPELEQLKQQVENHFINYLGNIIKADGRPFHPHITIANRDLKPTDFAKAWAHFSKIDLQESFQANTVSLLKLNEGRWDIVFEKMFSRPK